MATLSALMKFIKPVIIISCIFIASCFDDKNGYGLHAEGKVISIEWESDNHQIPLIQIKTNSARIKWFHSHKIILNSSNLKVGDNFKKVSDSVWCEVNEVEIQCLNK